MREPSRRTGDRPVVGLLVAAGAVALVTVGVVLRFGLVQPPALEPVDEATRPDVALAISSYRDNERGQCLDVVAPGRHRPRAALRDGRRTARRLGRARHHHHPLRVVRRASRGARPGTGAVLSSRRSTSRVVDARALGRDVDDRSGRAHAHRARRPVTCSGRSRRRTATGSPPPHATPARARSRCSTRRAAPRARQGRRGEPRVWVEDVGTTYGELVWQGTDR
jgi:hypothetical protein